MNEPINHQIEYALLNPTTAAAFVDLLPLSRRGWLQHIIADAPNSLTLGIGAFDGSTPVGIVLAEILPGGMLAEIRYLWASPSRRRAGIGTTLLNRIEDVLQERACPGMLFHYTPQSDNIAALPRIFEKLDWAVPQILLRTYKTDRRMTTLPWLDFEIELPDETEIFSWAELTASERERLESKLAQSEVNMWYVSPFFDEARIEPLNSLGLRYRGEVAGWLITHRVAPDTIRYNSIYIQESLRGLSGAAIALLVESIKRHTERPDEIPYAVFAVRQSNQAMQSVIKRYLAPHAISSAELWHSWKPKTLNFFDS